MNDSYHDELEDAKHMAKSSFPIWPSLILAAFVVLMVYMNGNNAASACDMTFTYDQDSIGFMEHGMLGSMETFYTIQKIDGHDWDNNLYFTGSSFSRVKSDAMKVGVSDSCLLKTSYFNWKEHQ
jgi:hypothetical protein